MKELLYYTRKPIDSVYYDARIAYSMHLGIKNGTKFEALNHNSGVLFALATENKDGSLNPKCLRNPFVFYKKDGSGFYILAVRTDGEGETDTESIGSILLWESKDLLRYNEIGMIKVGSSEVEKIFCEYDACKTAYKLMWSVDNGKWYMMYIEDFIADMQIRRETECESPAFSYVETDIEGAIDCNVIEVSDDIADRLVKKLTVPKHIGNKVSESIKVTCREELDNVRVQALYSDGTCASKRVDWDICGIDFAKPGEYDI